MKASIVDGVERVRRSSHRRRSHRDIASRGIRRGERIQPCNVSCERFDHLETLHPIDTAADWIDAERVPHAYLRCVGPAAKAGAFAYNGLEIELNLKTS